MLSEYADIKSQLMTDSLLDKVAYWTVLDTARQGCTTCGSLVAGLGENGERMRKWRANGERMRKWRYNEEMERYSLSTFPHFLFISFLSIHFQIKSCLILLQNVKYGTFVANVTKNLTYALWENNSGSNSLRESSASCEGLLLDGADSGLIIHKAGAWGEILSGN